jgi:hypothetical protein
MAVGIFLATSSAKLGPETTASCGHEALAKGAVAKHLS